MKFDARAYPILLAISLAMTLSAGSAHAAVGKVIFATGDVRIVDAKTGASRPAARDTSLEQGDGVVTGAGG